MLRPTHRTRGTGTHQRLIRHQPAGTVLGKQTDHIAIGNAEGTEAGSSSMDALVELLIGEALGVGGMGSIHRHHLGMLGREPGPHLIHPSPSVGMAMGG